jgi:hypothetical protein
MEGKLILLARAFCLNTEKRTISRKELPPDMPFGGVLCSHKN